MRIIFVRHGHPDYANDCLTEVGHLHAEAAAQRLSDETFCKIYASSCGRAVQTAMHIADARGMEIELCDFMREITWGPIDGAVIPHNGHPWYVADDMVAAGQTLMNENWEHEEPFVNNKVVSLLQQIGSGFDHLLAGLGYEREGAYYRVRKENPDNVVMVSHGGSSSAVLAHMFNLPFPFVCTTIRPEFTAITVVTLSGEEDSLISPRFEIVNDMRHIAHIAVENVYDN